MKIVPLWTRKIDLDTRALDPLGLSRISEFIVDELLPGLTTLTTRGRNYCFYCWAIQQANKEKVKSYSHFFKTLERVEAAYVVGGILDQRNFFPEGKGPIGRNRGLIEIENAQNGFIKVNFSVLKHSGGGYGQYYRNPMFRLGLIAQLQKSDELIQDGIILANCFEKNIQNTKYYRKYLSSDKIPEKVLKEYGQFCGYLRLNKFKNEQKALLSILFNKNKNLSHNENSRKISLQIILELYKIYTESQLEFDDMEFRNIIYHRQSKKDGILIKYHPHISSINKTLLQWRFFQFHEFFTYAIESIFLCFLDSLEENNTGLTLAEFTKMHSGFVKEFDIALKIDSKKLTLDEIIEVILKKNGINGSISKTTSELFDKKVGVVNEFSEVILKSKIEESFEKGEPMKIIGLSFCLLFTTIIRYWQYLDGFNEDNFWIMNREENEWCLRTYIKRIQPNISKMTLMDLFRLTIKDIVDTHDRIAYEKMSIGNDTFRFHRNGEIFSFKMEYTPEIRGDRFRSITNIFEDLGLIERVGDQFFISKFGTRFLETMNHE